MPFNLSVEKRFCVRCGASVPEEAQFCPRCGSPVPFLPSIATNEPVAPSTPLPAAPSSTPSAHAVQPMPPAAVSSTHTPKTSWIWLAVPAVILLILLGAWALLAGLPFGSKEKVERVKIPPPQKVEESSLPPETGTILEIGAEEETVPVVPGKRAAEPALEPSSKEQGTIEPPHSPAHNRSRTEISEEGAVAVLDGYLSRNDVYLVDASCLTISSGGYRNAGYTLEVVDRCEGSRLLGRWRVDSKTQELFRQREDGRYLRP